MLKDFFMDLLKTQGMKIDFNGNLFEENQPVFLAENRGYNYGDGLFETLRVIRGKIIFWEDHYNRLTSGMELLQMQIPNYWSKAYLQSRILDLITQNKLNDQPVRVKINVHRDASGLYKPHHHKIKYLIRTSPLGSDSYTKKGNDYRLGVFETHRISSGNLSNLKNTNKLINVLGSIYAEKIGMDNCLLLNDKGNPVETLNGNIFIVKGNSIITPPLSDGSLDGITRRKIIALAAQTTYQLKQATISFTDLKNAEEIWITNTIVGIQPITHYDKRTYENKVGEEFIDLLNVRVQKEIERD